MATPRVLVLRAPGTNCDAETAFAFERAGGSSRLVHVNQLREQANLLHDFQVLCIPGGFSYGDDIAAGRILGDQISHHLADAIHHFRIKEKLVLGICNGFQVLLKCGVLLKQDNSGPTATLAWNDSGRFEDRWVHLAVSGACVFLRGVDRAFLPIAHAEGKFVTRSSSTLTSLEQSGLLVLRYTSKDGGVAESYPDNPNGSLANVAGLCDPSGHVLGLMPHPERHIDPLQHPSWTRMQELPEFGDGFHIFRNAIQYFA